MSRTINTMPHSVQKLKHKNASWGEESGFPAPFGGAWEGRKLFAKSRNRKLRRRQDFEAKRLGEVNTVRKNNVAWDIY